MAANHSMLSLQLAAMLRVCMICNALFLEDASTVSQRTPSRSSLFYSLWWRERSLGKVRPFMYLSGKEMGCSQSLSKHRACDYWEMVPKENSRGGEKLYFLDSCSPPHVCFWLSSLRPSCLCLTITLSSENISVICCPSVCKYLELRC